MNVCVDVYVILSACNSGLWLENEHDPWTWTETIGHGRWREYVYTVDDCTGILGRSYAKVIDTFTST
jgi:hypothetical protein